MFLRGRCFVMASPIDMNVDVFWETSAGFLKCVVLQLFPKYSQSYVNLNLNLHSGHIRVARAWRSCCKLD